MKPSLKKPGDFTMAEGHGHPLVEETPKVNNVIDVIKVVVEGTNNTLNELYF